MRQAAAILILATLVALFLVSQASAAGAFPSWMDRTDEACTASAHVEALEGLDLETGLVADVGIRTASGVVVFWYSIDWCHGWSAP